MTYAQISGKVTDANKLAISGATVTVKGSDKATSTGQDGRFMLRVSPPANITISSIGYLSKTMDVTSADAPTIMLTSDTKSLNEVVMLAPHMPQLIRRLFQTTSTHMVQVMAH